jgi:signal transduction histidine kinase
MTTILSKLSMRQRLLIFGAIWLAGCTLLLTLYLVSEARQSLLQSMVERSQTIATRLAEEASLHLHTGNREGVENLLKEVTKQPDVLMALIEQNGRAYGNQISNVERLSPPGGLVLKGSHLVRVDGFRAIETTVPILIPSQTDVLSDETLFGRAKDSERQGQARIILSVEPIYAQLHRLVTKVMVFLGGVLFFGYLIGWLVSERMISPLNRLVEYAHISTPVEGSSTESSTPQTNHEIDLIWNSLTTMKHSLNRKTAEISRLQHDLEDTVRKRTADLTVLNQRLNEVLRLKNDLILQLSHEVKAPLTALSAFLENLRDGLVGPLTERQKDYLRRITHLSDRIKRLMSALLHYAIAETGNIQLDRRPVSISEMSKEVLMALQSFQEERGVTCVIAESIDGKSAFADQDRVEQVLMNLVHNAIKASPAGSDVVIETYEMGDDLVVSVKDSGPGICVSDQPRLLQVPLHSERKLGNGIGLYISRYLVELHGGRIWFESQEGNGTTFYFSLPKAQTSVVSRV